MAAKTDTVIRVKCPSCSHKAKRVSAVTLAALLKDELAETQFVPNGDSCCVADDGGCEPFKDNTGWRFCDSKDCEVVYFSEEGNTTFTKPQLKVSVGVKETSGERPLCYCFGHSVVSIKEEFGGRGRSDALEDIREKMKDPGCRCETENPSGSCCLGSVAKGIKIAQAELEACNSDAQPAATTLRVSSYQGERIAKVGTLLSAIMASACCWLPLILLAAGVSGAGIASALEAYRPTFVVVTFGFLAAAFYFTYRPRSATATEGDDCCAPPTPASDGCCAAPTSGVEDCCSTTASKRGFSMITLNKVILWVVTALAVAFLLFPSYVDALLGAGGGNTVTDDMNQAVFEVEGMTCEGCASIAEKAIRDVPGVLAAEVDYEARRAVAGVENGSPIPVQEIQSALKSAGYTGKLTKTSPAAAK